jgi:hypothetical protein
MSQISLDFLRALLWFFQIGPSGGESPTVWEKIITINRLHITLCFFGNLFFKPEVANVFPAYAAPFFKRITAKLIGAN